MRRPVETSSLFIAVDHRRRPKVLGVGELDRQPPHYVDWDRGPLVEVVDDVQETRVDSVAACY